MPPGRLKQFHRSGQTQGVFAGTRHSVSDSELLVDQGEAQDFECCLVTNNGFQRVEDELARYVVRIALLAFTLSCSSSPTLKDYAASHP